MTDVNNAIEAESPPRRGRPPGQAKRPARRDFAGELAIAQERQRIAVSILTGATEANALDRAAMAMAVLQGDW